MLTIEPGVDVVFQGYYRFYISGELSAIGTATDSIRFVPQDTITGWRSLYFAAPGSCQMAYCNIEYARESGIHMQGVALYLKVTRCKVAHCRSEYGGGISVWGIGSTLDISHSAIVYNTAESSTGGKGGGIYLDFGTLLMESCTVDANRAVIPVQDNNNLVWGGGIYIGTNSVYNIISNSLITDNFVGLSDGGYSNGDVHPDIDGGAGIYSKSDELLIISKCLFSGNNVNAIYGAGGGIFIDRAARSTTISHCVFNNNWLHRIGFGGAGLFANGKADVVNCTFYKNHAPSELIEAIKLMSNTTNNIINNIVVQNKEAIKILTDPSNINLRYNDILGNCSGMPPGFGVTDNLNHNGHPCDSFFNIFMDPLFADTINGNLHLLAGSPCIDAGNPASELDPDSTVADIGAYFFNQKTPLIVLSDSLLDFGTLLIGQSADSVLKIYNNGSDKLVIHRVINSQEVFVNNFNPSDSLILPGDSISITITFTPVNDLAISDTLFVYNNDQNCYVKFTGTGKSSTGIFKIDDFTPDAHFFWQAYPNPFNSNTRIEFNLPVKIDKESGGASGTTFRFTSL